MTSPAKHPDTSSTVYSLQGLVLKFDDKASIKPYLDQLEEVEDLQEVRFGGNTLGVEACEAVAESLSRKKSLKIADFSDIFTGRLITEIPQSLRALCTSLLSLPVLISLDLSDNAFGGRSAEPMLEFIGNHAGLQVLKLNNNGMGPAGGEMIANALLANANKAKKEGRKPNLKTLICGRNRLENGSSKAFAAAFSALGSLVEVRMPQNGIRMEGIEQIVKGLQSNPNLQVLDLQDNTATVSGSRAIAASLPYWPQLHSLNLSDCLLRPKGGISLITPLSKGSNPLLKSLKLQSNELDSRSINLLAGTIGQHLKHLVELELNGNRGEESDECYENVRTNLEKWGHSDALDELDELEEDESDDEESDEEVGEAEIVEKDEAAEEAEPTKEAPKQESDELSNLLNKVHIA